MKHKTWFRLQLKIIGVLFFFLGVSFSLPGAVAMAGSAYMNSGVGNSFAWSDVLQILFFSPLTGSGILLVVFGLYLFFGGNRIVNRAIPSNRPYCPSCGYDLYRNWKKSCPECGVALPADESPVSDD